MGLYRNPRHFLSHICRAHADVMAMLKDIEAEPDETPGVHLIERIEMLPMTKDTLLALLNEGMGAVLKSYEIVETVG